MPQKAAAAAKGGFRYFGIQLRSIEVFEIYGHPPPTPHSLSPSLKPPALFTLIIPSAL